MSERPIIFSTESVNAILAGRKTMTRRVIKPQPDFLKNGQWRYDGFCSKEDGGYDVHWFEKLDEKGEPTEKYDHVGKCPFGKPGDRLWVREAYYADGVVVFYREDYAQWGIGEIRKDEWKSPMFMPRWCSRLTLEIVNVRCEQLLDMPQEDVYAEGYGSMCDFRHAWNSLNEKRGYSWESDPWVWVLEFKKMKGENT
jgi:hypothetical protein